MRSFNDAVLKDTIGAKSKGPGYGPVEKSMVFQS